MAGNNKSSVNSFAKGMSKDADSALHQKTTYRNSKNGRVIFKEDGSYAWSNMLGNKLSFSLPRGYTIKGHCELKDRLILLLYKYNHGMIGQVTFNKDKVIGKWQTLFDDDYDADGKKLNLLNYAEMVPGPETSTSEDNEAQIERVYWTDDLNEPRSFNVRLGFKYVDEISTNITDPFGSPTGGVYPSWYSVHNMALEPDFDMGHIELYKHIEGQLKSGAYQYTYRLITRDGKTTPWTPVTNKLTVVDRDWEPAPGPVTPSPDGDWNEYYLKDVGKYSSKGLQLFVYINDSRFSKFEVAYNYYISNTAPIESLIFHKGIIGEETLPSNQDINIVNHAQNTGVVAAKEEFVQRYIPVAKAKTIAIKDNILFMGNYKERILPQLTDTQLANITLEPIFRMMKSDIYKNRGQASPQTNAFVTGSASATKNMYLNHGTGIDAGNSYTVIEDFENYKGTQIESSFTGYFRGETYRFGILFYDKKGKPGFVQHIGDITFPEMWGKKDFIGVPASHNGKYTVKKFDTAGDVIDTEYQAVIQPGLTGAGNPQPCYLTECCTNNTETLIAGATFPDTSQTYWIRIMGLSVSGIDVTDIKDDISGYAIVRAKRDQRLLGQGLLMGVLHPVDDEGAGNSDRDKCYPLPTTYNEWHQKTDGSGGGLTGTRNGATVDSDGYIEESEPTMRVHTFESPDFMIEAAMGNTITLSNTDYLYIAGWVLSGYDPAATSTDPAVVPNNIGPTAGDNLWGVKTYRTGSIGINAVANINIDAAHNALHPQNKSKVESLSTVDAGGSVIGFHETSQKLHFINQHYRQDFENNLNQIKWPHNFGAPTENTKKMRAFGHNGTSLVTTKENWWALTPYSLPHHTHHNNAHRFAIVNYIKEGGGTYGGVNKNSLSETSYEQIGEFKAITSSTETAIFHSGSGKYRIDNLEIWGGDCYTDYFSYARMMPLLHFEKPEEANKHCDKIDMDGALFSSADRDATFGVAQYFPVESKYNFTLHKISKSVATKGLYGGKGFYHPAVAGSDNEWGKGYFAARNAWHAVDNPLFDASTSCIEEEIEKFDVSLIADVHEPFYKNVAKPIDYETIVDLPYTWIWSLGKTLGETLDNYTKFPIAQRKDMSPAEGEIVGNGAAHNTLYSFQESGVARMPINQKAIVNSTDGSPFVIGNAGVFDTVEYMSLEYGTKHQRSIIESGKAIYFVDSLKGKICQISGQGFNLISDNKGMHDFTEKYVKDFINQGTIHGIFDHKNHDIIYTFVTEEEAANEDEDGDGFPDDDMAIFNQSGTTILFNELLNVWHGFMDSMPYYWFTYGDSLFSDHGIRDFNTATLQASQNHNLYVYNEYEEGSFFGQYFDSEIELIINDSAMYSKVFDNVVLNMNPDAAPLLSKIDLTTEMGTQTITVTGDNRLKYRELFHRFPLRGLTDSNRTRGKWLKMKLVFNNTGGKDIRLSSVETKYRVSLRV